MFYSQVAAGQWDTSEVISAASTRPDSAQGCTRLILAAGTDMLYQEVCVSPH